MSIKKIAEKAGVSPATVSRVLNNPNYKCSVPGLRDKRRIKEIQHIRTKNDSRRQHSYDARQLKPLTDGAHRQSDYENECK